MLMFIFKSLKCPNLKVRKNKILLPQCGSTGYPLMVKRQMFFTTFERWLKELGMAHFGRGLYGGLVYNFHHCPQESYVSEGHGVTMDMVSECYVNWF